MSDKPKAVPFAKPVQRILNPSAWAVVIDGSYMASDTEEVARAYADHANAAVAAREARLVAALISTRARDVDSEPCWCHVPPNISSTGQHATHCLNKRAALEGTGPDVVAELRAQVKAMQAVVDAAYGGVTPDALVPFLRAHGLAEDKTPIENFSADELIEEIRRRGYYVVNPGKAPKPSEREQLPRP